MVPGGGPVRLPGGVGDTLAELPLTTELRTDVTGERSRFEIENGREERLKTKPLQNLIFFFWYHIVSTVWDRFFLGTLF